MIKKMKVSRGNAIVAGVIIFNIVVIFGAIFLFCSTPSLYSVALLAYVFGLRHAVDADHIAAIDNATRKLLNEGKNAAGAGMFFSLGHASIVIVACLIFAITATPVQNMFPEAKEVGATLSTLISGFFLLFLAAVNARSLFDAWREKKQGVGRNLQIDNEHSYRHGFVTRITAPLFLMVSKARHLYFIGVLFGIGFDTATEVAIFGMSVSQAAGGAPLFHIMMMPLLFTAGMLLIDSLDGLMMIKLYSWSKCDPIRKVNYNIAISSLSIVAAVVIGGFELTQVISAGNGFGEFYNRSMDFVMENGGVGLIFTSVAVWGIFYIRHKIRQRSSTAFNHA